MCNNLIVRQCNVCVIIFQTFSFCRVEQSMESLFWSLFGLTDLEMFAIDKPEFEITRQTGVALFGFYQVLMAIVAINMLIAMMTRSFESIVVRCLICKSRKKPYTSHIHISLNCLALQNTPPPPGNSNPFCVGGGMGDGYFLELHNGIKLYRF